MKIKFVYLLAFPLLLVFSGCTSVAPSYVGSRQNIEAINAIGDFNISVGKFVDSEAVDNKKQLSIRANTTISPYGQTYSSYLENAIRQDLLISGHYSQDSKIRISGILLKNDIDASGFSVGTGICEVEFNLSNNSTELYRKRFVQEHQWESSFAGAVAIPKAINEYPVMIEKLINKLLSDNDFIKAIKSSKDSR